MNCVCKMAIVKVWNVAQSSQKKAHSYFKFLMNNLQNVEPNENYIVPKTFP
jgi:hypothetical protein